MEARLWIGTAIIIGVAVTNEILRRKKQAEVGELLSYEAEE